jgi:mannose/fructose/N-acetylgalactosamine-specific phosphotransferase system component IIC
LELLLLSLVAGLAAVERKGFLQAMLSRPVALAPLAGWALGDLDGGLLLAAPLELFWLGAVNLGAALPPHEALGTCAITGAAVLAGAALGTGVTPAVAVAAVLLLAPLAQLGRRADAVMERWNERLTTRAEAELAHDDPRAAARVNLYGLLLPFLFSAVVAPMGAAAGAVVIPAVVRAAPSAIAPLQVGWFAFAAFACAAGAKAFRARAAPRLFFAAASAGVIAGVALGRAM